MRGALAAGAVVLADVALLSLSRGSVFATAALLAAAFLLFPGRLRTFAVLMPVGLGVAVSLPFLLKVGDRLEAPETTAAAAHAAESAVTHAAIAIFAAAVLVGLAVTAACALEYNGRRWPTVRPRARRAVAVLAALTAVVGVGGAFTATGDPVAKVGHEWNTFTSPQGYGANSKGNRLISGLGSSRYDFYRVALDEFASHPLLGIGADNFEAQYLRKGHSDETPHYPHSVELRTLTETGLVGAALALVGLGAALVAARRALRRADALGRAAAAGALVGFGYWAVHGSVDWFFEYAGLGAQAFALLGIACALDPARAPVGRGAGATGGAWRVPRFTRGAAQRRILLGVPLAAMALAIAWALAVPWLTGLEEQRAAHIWEKAPATAYSELNSAASLDGLSPGPYLLAASIALRRGEVAHADHEFVLALTRAPEDEYATLERGAIASAQGETARSVRLLERAVALYPRGRLGHEALQYARTGQRVSLTLLNSVILKEGQELQ
jgi:tetratricopeptide (TPR) repeat protein